MQLTLETAPGRIDVRAGVERLASYQYAGFPGFSLLAVPPASPVTAARTAGISIWIGHGAVDGFAFTPDAAENGERSTRLVVSDLVVRRGPHSVGFQHETMWMSPNGEQPLSDRRTLRFQPGPASGVLIDLSLTLEATADPVRLTTSRQGLLVAHIARELAPDGGGWIRNATGHTAVAHVDGAAAAWVTFSGQSHGEPVGIALLDHPDNPWYPTPWTASAEGDISPCPFAWRTAMLIAGQPLRLRYRIVTHAGYVNPEWIDARLRDFAEA